MKKRIIPILTVALSLLCASVCDAYYLLRLKNRGAVTTPAYWFEGNKILFYVSGGIASLERREIVKIENLEKEVSDYKQRTAAIAEKKEPPAPPPAAEKAKNADKSPAEAQPIPESGAATQQPPEKIDLKAYQDKMTSLKADLNKSLTSIRNAESSKDLKTRDEATAENRRISEEMWKLTTELKSKNNGKLPEDWWTGVGQAEPETK